MSLHQRTIPSKSLPALASVDLTIHTFRTVDRTAGRRFAVVARFEKRWEFGDNREVFLPLFANLHHHVHAVVGACGSQTLHARQDVSTWPV